ncbi:MAG: hypothetical protein ABSC55_24405 [Syntrophorhabdales bacterium]|jgi:tartrate dehydratase beta subunit/fumarate hydratase class I family protein
MAELASDKGGRERDLESAIEITKAFAMSSVGKSADILADTIEKTYRVICKLHKEQT